MVGRADLAGGDDFERDDVRVAGAAIGAIGDYGEFVPAGLFGEPVHRDAIIPQAFGVAFAGLLQLLVDIELDALDPAGCVPGVNLDIEDDALNDLLVMSGKEDLRLRDRWRGDLRRQRHRRHKIAGGEADEDKSERQCNSR